jgi:hypothetical protein
MRVVSRFRIGPEDSEMRLPPTPTAALGAAVSSQMLSPRRASAYETLMAGDLPFLQTILLSPFFFTLAK